MTVEPNHLSDNLVLTMTAELHPKVFESAFNSGRLELVIQAYEEFAVFTPQPGHPLASADLEIALANFLALGLPIEVTTRHAYVADDVALLIVDWRIHGVTPDGNEVDITGTATDVARRGTDGYWRYLIDNPFGSAAE